MLSDEKHPGFLTFRLFLLWPQNSPEFYIGCVYHHIYACLIYFLLGTKESLLQVKPMPYNRKEFGTQPAISLSFPKEKNYFPAETDFIT